MESTNSLVGQETDVLGGPADGEKVTIGGCYLQLMRLMPPSNGFPWVVEEHRYEWAKGDDGKVYAVYAGLVRKLVETDGTE